MRDVFRIMVLCKEWQGTDWNGEVGQGWARRGRERHCEVG